MLHFLTMGSTPPPVYEKLNMVGATNGINPIGADLSAPYVFVNQDGVTDIAMADNIAGEEAVFWIINGRLWALGSNAYGKLGLAADATTPTQVGTKTDWVKIYPARNTTFAIDSGGVVYGTGRNDQGQLGLGDLVDRSTFTALPGTWEGVYGDEVYRANIFLINSAKELWVAGRDLLTLGHSETVEGNKPTLMQSTTDKQWEKVTHSNDTTLALSTDGEVWSWGSNARGRLGRGLSTSFSHGPGKVGTANNWIDIQSHFYTSFFLNASNELYGCGQSELLNFGSFQQDVDPMVFITDDVFKWEAQKKYGGIEFHIIILKNDGTLWGAGKNTEGMLGLGDTDEYFNLTQIGVANNWIDLSVAAEQPTFVVKNDLGELWTAGACSYTGYGSDSITLVQLPYPYTNQIVTKFVCNGQNALYLTDPV